MKFLEKIQNHYFTGLVQYKTDTKIKEMAENFQTVYDKMLNQLYSHTVPLINTGEVSKLLTSEKEAVILDIRSEKEYWISHLPQAHFYNYETFNAELLTPEMKSKNLILYCTVGYRSEKAGEKLLNSGFKQVHNLYGGIIQWLNDGFYVVDPAGRQTNHVHTYNKKWSQWLLKGKEIYE